MAISTARRARGHECTRGRERAAYCDPSPLHFSFLVREARAAHCAATGFVRCVGFDDILREQEDEKKLH